MPTVELIPAYVYDCNACGRENFVRSVQVHDPDDLAELREQFGIEEDETVDFCTRPKEVTCGHCGAEYETEDMGEG